MAIDRNAEKNEEIVCKERSGYLTTSLKCIMDSGDDTGIIAKSKGLISLGRRSTTIHTCIGTKNQILEEVSLFN